MGCYTTKKKSSFVDYTDVPWCVSSIMKCKLIWCLVCSASLFLCCEVAADSSNDSIIDLDEDGSDDDKEPLRIENGLFALSSLDDIQRIVENRIERRTNTLSANVCFLLLFYRPTCSRCAAIVEKAEEATRLMMNHFETTTDSLGDFIAPVFAKLDVDQVGGREAVDEVGVTEVPTLVFVLAGKEHNFTLEYSGRKKTARDIFQTTLHYFYRLAVTSGEVRYAEDSINVYPRQFQDMQGVKNFFQGHSQFFLDASAVEPSLPPTLSDEEKSYVRWLLEDEKEEGMSGGEFILLVQCRHSSELPNALYDTFDAMSQVLTSRRDRLFLSNAGCDLEISNGSVLAWKIPMNFKFEGGDQNWKDEFRQCASHSLTGHDETDSQQLVEFIIKISTPSILWFDRQSTAPIAFPRYRKVHALLFIDFHLLTPPRTNTTKSIEGRAALRRFRQACRQHRRGQPRTVDRACVDQDLVCLVVPSTETRVLTTFGIDIWSPLDEAAPDYTPDSILPTVLITDQRVGGTLRYYLDADQVLSSPTAMDDFVADFWAGQLQPHFKSSSSGSHTTESGVHILTTDSVQKELVENVNKNHHSLLFFTAPTCGHCKRFSVVWNQLADLLNHMEWSHLVKLYQIDVTTDEFVGLNITVRWIPDLYVLTPHNRRLVRYNETDELGDDVGRINTPMEILIWLLSEGDYDREQLQALLQELEDKF